MPHSNHSGICVVVCMLGETGRACIYSSMSDVYRSCERHAKDSVLLGRSGLDWDHDVI